MFYKMDLSLAHYLWLSIEITVNYLLANEQFAQQHWCIVKCIAWQSMDGVLYKEEVLGILISIHTKRKNTKKLNDLNFIFQSIKLD